MGMSACTRCGAAITPNQFRCPSCGFQERPELPPVFDTSDGQATDVVSTIIPYTNPLALTSYYLGCFSAIPLLGLLLGPAALVTGILGLRKRMKHPEMKGLAHALVGVIVGGLVFLAHLGVILLIVLKK